MTNVKRKSLVYALILTLCLGVIPFNVASFQAAAKTKSKAPAVTAKTYSKKAGRYTVKVKQAKVDYKTVNVYVPGVKTLKKVKGKKKVYKIKATAYMYCDKKVSKKKSKTVKLSSISSKKKYFTMAAPAMGKYNFVVKYYNKKGKKLKTVTVKNSRHTAVISVSVRRIIISVETVLHMAVTELRLRRCRRSNSITRISLRR